MRWCGIRPANDKMCSALTYDMEQLLSEITWHCRYPSSIKSPETSLVVHFDCLQSQKCLFLEDRYSFLNFKGLKTRCPSSVPILRKGVGFVHLAQGLRKGRDCITCICRNFMFLMKELLNQAD